MQIKINEIKNKKNIIDIRTRFEFNEFNIGGRNITRINLLRNPEYYLDKKAWARSCLINIAMSGYFSSDRTIEEYNRDIWHLSKIPNK